MKEEKSAFERIYDIIREITEGKVASYGQVAELAGNRRWARVVGYALHAVSYTHLCARDAGINFLSRCR